MSVLTQIGFAADEIIQGWEERGRLVVPAVIAGENVGLVVSTERTAGLTLNTRYALHRGFTTGDRMLIPSTAVGHGPTEAAFANVPDCQVLGVEAGFDRVAVTDGAGDRFSGADHKGRPPLAGAIGKMLLRERTVAFDFSAASIAVTAPFSLPWAQRSHAVDPMYRMSMLGEPKAWWPFVRDIRVFDQPMTVLLDTSERSAGLWVDTVEQAVAGNGISARLLRWQIRRHFRRRRSAVLFLTLPDETSH